MSLDAITKSLSKLSIAPAAAVSHGATNSPASWREALEGSSAAPKEFELIKTLVYKPKTAKTATPVPVVVIAREKSDVPSGVLGKTLNLKELRLASEDLLKEFFSLDKNSRESLSCYHSATIHVCGTPRLSGVTRSSYPRRSVLLTCSRSVSPCHHL